MSVIGKLRVLLGLDSSEFVRGTNRAKQANEELNESIERTRRQTQKPLPTPPIDPKNPLVNPKPAQEATKKLNMLNFQIQQVARELPSLALGPQMFFLALSNNLPMLTDEVARAKKEYKELAAAGEKATPVWKQMLSGILSWQTALVVGITLLVAYGKEIGNFVSELFTGKKAFDAAEVAASNFHRAMTEGVVNAAEETTKLDLLYKAATDNKKSYEDRKTAAEELQSIYPAYFGNLATERIMIGEAVSKYNDLRTAIIETSRARAALDMTTELQKELLILENTGDAFDDLRQKAEKANEAREAYKYATPQYSFSEGGNREITPEKFQLERAERAVEKATERIKEKLLKLSGGKELWDKIEEDFNGNVLDFAETANQTIERLAPKAELGLTVESPDDLNEKAKKAAEQAAAAARKAYESTLAYSESENSKAIAALEKEQGAYGTTIAYMEKMLQLRREQETYAKSEAEYQKIKKENDQLERRIELTKAVYESGSRRDIEKRISDAEAEMQRINTATADGAKRWGELNEQVKQYKGWLESLPKDYAAGSVADLQARISGIKKQMENLNPDIDSDKIDELRGMVVVYQRLLDKAELKVKVDVVYPEGSLGELDQQISDLTEKTKTQTGADLEATAAALKLAQARREVMRTTIEGSDRLTQATAKLREYEAELQAASEADKAYWQGMVDHQRGEVRQIIGELQILGELESGIRETVAGIGEALGNLATGDYSGATSALLNPIADMLIQLGKLSISTGITLEALRESFKWFKGVGAIIAGTALVALGTAIKNKVGAMPEQSPATGGGGGYNTFTGGGYNPGYSNNGAYRYAAANVASAGTNVTVDVKGALKGEDIALAVKKVTYNKSR